VAERRTHPIGRHDDGKFSPPLKKRRQSAADHLKPVLRDDRKLIADVSRSTTRPDPDFAEVALLDCNHRHRKVDEHCPRTSCSRVRSAVEAKGGQ
jgi:hypothetical protein